MGGLNMAIRRQNDVGKEELNHEQFKLIVDWSNSPPAISSIQFTDKTIFSGCEGFNVTITAWNKYILCEFKCGTVQEVLDGKSTIERVDISGSSALPEGMSESTKFEVNVIDTTDQSIRRRSKRGGAAPNADDLIIMLPSKSIGQLPYEFSMKENGVVVIEVNENLHTPIRKKIRDRTGAHQEFMLLESVRFALGRYLISAAAHKAGVLSEERYDPWLAVLDGLGIKPLSATDHETLSNVETWVEDAVKAIASDRKSTTNCLRDTWFMKK